MENFFKKIKDLEATIVFYESPKRILKTLAIIEKILGNVSISIAKEISKIHEEYLRGNLNTIKELLIKQNKKLKGEITIVLRK